MTIKQRTIVGGKVFFINFAKNFGMSLLHKISFFKSLLEKQEYGYRQEIKQEIYSNYFELKNGSFDFLKNLNTDQDIETRLDLVIHKMIMHEHEDGLLDIMEVYLS